MASANKSALRFSAGFGQAPSIGYAELPDPAAFGSFVPFLNSALGYRSCQECPVPMNWLGENLLGRILTKGSSRPRRFLTGRPVALTSAD
jgi:hypothetical protein